MLSGFLLLFLTILRTGTATRVVLSNNGYENVVVAIEDTVPESQSNDVITAIKNAFAEASSYLYMATGQRAYFRSISIVVPSSWSSSHAYATAVSESFETADVKIGILDQFDQAFTVRSISLCGHPADYIFATPGRFTDVRGNPAGRMLVHQWAKYRWGIYDEHPTSPSQLYSFYSNGRFEATRCTSGIRGDVVHTDYRVSCHPTTATDECKFRPSVLDNAAASVMFYQQMDTIKQFCGISASHSHNSEADNDQNALCNYTSTWDVISKHDDFSSGLNTPRSLPQTGPAFSVVRSLPYEQIVLALDVSSSMLLDGRLDRLRSAAYSFIRTVPPGTRIGIVAFNGSALDNIELTAVEGKQSMELLSNALPLTAGGTTSIGSGLRAAVEMIKRSNNGKVVGGCSVIVINDGDETPGMPGTIDDVFDDIVNSGVRVFPITLETSGSRSTSVSTFGKLGDLARRTNGYQYLVSDVESLRQITLCEAMVSVSELAISRHRGPIQVLQRSISVPASRQVEVNVTIDSASRTSAYFQATVEKYIDHITVETTDPVGLVTKISNISRPTGFTVMSDDADSPEPGVWRVRLTSDLPSVPIVIALSVILHTPASTSTIVEEPVTVTASLSERNLSVGRVPVISVSVKKGEKGVAKAEVEAFVVLPSAATITTTSQRLERRWILYDGGANPDYAADDGIYSGYFTKLKFRGEYSVRVRVSGTEHSITVPPAPYTDTAALYFTYESSIVTTTQTHATGSFSRAISAGMFITNDYQPDDIFPPSRITDLRISSNYNASSVSLSWSAPGDDYDRGSAGSYVVKYAENDAYDLRTRFASQLRLRKSWITKESSPVLDSPGTAGHVEYLNITLPQRNNVTYYFAVAAADDSGLEGAPSPVVGIALLSPQMPAKPGDESSGFSTGIIAAIVVCSLVVTLAICFVAWLCLRRYRRSQAEAKGKIEEKEKLRDLEADSTPGGTPSPKNRTEKRERRAKKKKLSTDEKEQLVSDDVVSRATDTTYLAAISETDLPHHPYQQENAQQETLEPEKEESKQAETQGKEQMLMDPELQQIQLTTADPSPAHEHKRSVGISQRSAPTESQLQHLLTTNLDPEMQHAMLSLKQQQQQSFPDPGHAAQNGEHYTSSDEQINKVLQRKQSSKDNYLQNQLHEEIQTSEVVQLENHKTKQEQSQEEIQEWPDEYARQESREETVTEKTESVRVCEEEGVDVYSHQDKDGKNQDDDKPVEDTSIIRNFESSAENEPTEEEGDNELKMPQNASNDRQPLEQENIESDVGTATPIITKHSNADEAHEHYASTTTESSKDIDLSTSVIAPSQEDKNLEGNNNQQISSFSHGSEEARGHIQNAVEGITASPSPTQSEQKASEPEQSQSTETETGSLTPVAARTVTIRINEDEMSGVGHLVVLTLKGKDTDIAKKLSEDDDRSSQGQFDQGTDVTINTSSSQQSLDSAEITAIDEVSIEKETLLETTTIDDIEDNFE
jgi:Mg-chelatase subunit ChlD